MTLSPQLVLRGSCQGGQGDGCEEEGEGWGGRGGLRSSTSLSLQVAAHAGEAELFVMQPVP